MKKTLSIIILVAIVALAIGAALFTHMSSRTAAAKLAKMDSGVTRVDPVPADALPVLLWGVAKADLDGLHSAAICDVGASRLAFLKQDPIDASTTYGLTLPIAGDTPKQGDEWAGQFSYSYRGDQVACEFFGVPFKITSQGVVSIGEETRHLSSRSVIVVDPENRVIETRKLEQGPNAFTWTNLLPSK